MAAEPLHVLLAGSFPAPPALTARSAILIEARTGAILFENHADDPIPPASLTKLMTLHIALQRIDDGLLDPSRVIMPPPDSWARNLPPHSSVMFLGPGQRLTINELLKGLVVDSGNDAAVALADVIAGSVPAFADVMNEEASRLGYHVMRFVEPSGLSSANLITAREYVDFCRRFVTLHPRALTDLFSLRELTYPLPENLSGDNNERPITQKNTNILLGHYEGVDGLKTGHIDESGYNFAATARRGNMRLISVILGVPDQVPGGGLRMRAVESEELLDYGFSNFTLVQPTYAPPSPVRVWKGSARVLAIAPGRRRPSSFPAARRTAWPPWSSSGKRSLPPLRRGRSWAVLSSGSETWSSPATRCRRRSPCRGGDYCDAPWTPSPCCSTAWSRRASPAGGPGRGTDARPHLTVARGVCTFAIIRAPGGFPVQWRA